MTHLMIDQDHYSSSESSDLRYRYTHRLRVYKPHRMHYYRIHYPLCHKGIGLTFAYYIIRAIDIGVQAPSIFCLVESPFDTPATKAVLFFIIWLVDGH